MMVTNLIYGILLTRKNFVKVELTIVTNVMLLLMFKPVEKSLKRNVIALII